jgi:hypothetical protein
MAEEKQMSESEKKKEDWMNTKWRPAMGWMYMAVCVADFILFPVLWAVIQFWETSAANDAFRQWQPLTLQGAGLFHMAMGAVLGLAAWGRTQEKINGASTTSTALPSMDTPISAPTVPPVVKAPPVVAPPKIPTVD